MQFFRLQVLSVKGKLHSRVRKMTVRIVRARIPIQNSVYRNCANCVMELRDFQKIWTDIVRNFLIIWTR